MEKNKDNEPFLNDEDEEIILESDDIEALADVLSGDEDADIEHIVNGSIGMEDQW